MDNQSAIAIQDIFITQDDLKYLVNDEKICSSFNGTLSYIVYIHIEPRAMKRRNKLRNGWARANAHGPEHPSRLIFFMGRPTGVNRDQVIRVIRREALRHRDVVMLNFDDAYVNLTYKAIGAFKWIDEFCPNVNYIFKSDSDSWIAIPKALSYLEYKNRTKSNRLSILNCSHRHTSFHVHFNGVF